MTTLLYGYKMHLLLEDENGELFEVARPLVFDGMMVEIDTNRVLEAIDSRNTTKVGAGWPVY